ncbi:DUF6531 domain-containing protein [Archangium violaceum]|uniref:DUF6531 domain-containing protein n=1 Tax=Archangium violaceum TaxID=83451 RepID=UPI0037BF0D07
MLTYVVNEGTHCEYPSGEDCDDGVDNDQDGERDEGCLDTEPKGGPPPTMCNETNQFDPVNMVTGTTFERIKDVEVFDSVMPLSFERTFSSRGDEWVHDGPMLGAPKPFGASVLNPSSMEWWHNWMGVVVEHTNFWSVRDREGALLRFTPCTGVPCQATLSQGNPSQRERLWRTASGYELLQRDGSRLVFEARFVPAQGGHNRYFLSRILSPKGVVLATLDYAAPAVADCDQGGPGSSPGVPYLSSVRTVGGAFVELQLPEADVFVLGSRVCHFVGEPGGLRGARGDV